MDLATPLPHSAQLPVKYLASSFKEVTNSYKFYWFLSILAYLKETQSPTIPINQILARMIGGAWYPANYFLLSFGKQDRLGQLTLAIKPELNLNSNAQQAEIIQAIVTYLKSNTPLAQEITSLGLYVPYRFLSPFFPNELRGQPDWKKNNLVKQLAEQNFTHNSAPCLYRFSAQQDRIEIQPRWFDYLQEQLAIVTGFCLWHLHNYLQKHNPNVPNIATKLFQPEERDLRESRLFWQDVFKVAGTIRCIYSGAIMEKRAYSLDHFLPWRFVTHDLLWNIIPTPRNVNSAKSDRLPHFPSYFEPFARLQYDAFQAVATLQKERLLEDYTLLFKKQSANEVRELPFEVFKSTLHDTIAPQLQIARNMGFVGDWSYRST